MGMRHGVENPNLIAGCISVLQIEHIDLEFNIEDSSFLSSSPPPLSTVGKGQAAAIGGG
jgi:hypothetical protein